MPITGQQGFVIHGENDAIRKGVTKSVSKNGGQNATITYVGPLAPMDDLYAEVSAQVESDSDAMGAATYAYEDGIATITCEWPVSDVTGGSPQLTNEGDGLITEYWELSAITDTINLIAHPYFQKAIKDETAKALTLAKIAQYIDGSKTAVIPYATLTDPEKKYYDYYVKGKKTIKAIVPVLYHTKIVTGKSQITAAWANVMTAITLADIDPPAALLGVIGGPYFGNWPQWVVQTPMVKQIDKIRWEISQSYEWEYEPFVEEEG